jgi:hypothetical protein
MVLLFLISTHSGGAESARVEVSLDALGVLRDFEVAGTLDVADVADVADAAGAPDAPDAAKRRTERANAEQSGRPTHRRSIVGVEPRRRVPPPCPETRSRK